MDDYSNFKLKKEAVSLVISCILIVSFSLAGLFSPLNSKGAKILNLPALSVWFTGWFLLLTLILVRRWPK